MSIINYDNSSKAFRHFNNFIKGRDVTIHAKHTIGYDQPLALAIYAVHQRCEVLHIGVTIYDNAGPGQTAAINDTGMIKFITKDNILGTGQSTNNTDICHITSVK